MVAAKLRVKTLLSLLAIFTFVLLAPVHAGDTTAAQSSTIDAKEALRVSQVVIGKPIGDHTLLDRRPVRLATYRGKAVAGEFYLHRLLPGSSNQHACSA